MDYVPSLEKLKRLRQSYKTLDVSPDPPTSQHRLNALISPLLEFLDIGE